MAKREKENRTQKSTNTKKHVQRNLEESTRTIQGEKTDRKKAEEKVPVQLDIHRQKKLKS